MAQASLRSSGKRAADAGASVHRVIRRRSSSTLSNGGTTGSGAQLAAMAQPHPASNQGSIAAAAGSAAAAAPSQVLPWAAAASTTPQAQAQFAPAPYTPPGCALGTPASNSSASTSVPPPMAAGLDSMQQQQQPQAAPDGSGTQPVLGVPTFPSMALAAAKSGCFGMPFSMGMMPPPPFFMFMMQRQMAMMQQAMQAAGGGGGGMGMGMMHPFMSGMQQHQPLQPQQQQHGMTMFGSGNPAMMQAAGNGLPCYPPLAGVSTGGVMSSDQASGAKPMATSHGFMQHQHHQPLLPSLDIAAVVSALAEAQQLDEQGASAAGSDSATTTITRSSAGGGGVAADGALLARSDTRGGSHGSRPSSSADTLTGGRMAHHQGALLFDGGGAVVDQVGAQEQEQEELTDLEFNSFIDSFLLGSSAALAGSSGALDTLAAGAGGAGSGASVDALGLMMLDPVTATGDPALDLHLPLGELLPELAMEPTDPTAAPQPQPQPGGALPLGLALEPQSVLERLGHLAAGGGNVAAADGGATPAVALA